MDENRRICEKDILKTLRAACAKKRQEWDDERAARRERGFAARRLMDVVAEPAEPAVFTKSQRMSMAALVRAEKKKAAVRPRTHSLRF